MNFEEVSILAKKSWSKETCDDTLKDKWTKNNPALGQSLVTAIFVNENLGGHILACASKVGNHYYNVIDGDLVDFAYIGSSVKYDGSVAFSKEYLLRDENVNEKYSLFLDNVEKNKKNKTK